MSMAFRAFLLAIFSVFALQWKSVIAQPGAAEPCLTPIGGISRADIGHPLIHAAYKALTLTEPKYSLFVYREQRELLLPQTDPITLFLDGVCSDYADNRELLKAKLEQLSRIHVVPEKERQSYTNAGALWHQLTGDGYRRLLFLTREISNYRDKQLKQPEFGRRAPEPLTVCETKYIFKEYLSQARGLNNDDQLREFERGFARFSQGALVSGECSDNDLEDIYVFRGEGRLSTISTESNVMAAAARAYRRYCQSRSSKDGILRITKSPICNYFIDKPYETRFNASLALARSLLFYSEDYKKVMSMVGSPIILVDDSNRADHMRILLLALSKSDVAKEIKALTRRFYSAATGTNRSKLPQVASRLYELLAFTQEKKGDSLVFSGDDFLRDNGKRHMPDEGFARLFRTSAGAIPPGTYSRLAIAFDRHTYFYRTSLYFSKLRRYFLIATPWQSASSYIHQSHKFTFSGFAMGSMKVPRMRWMHVFRVKRSNYYSLQRMIDGDIFDLNASWFNEREFSNHQYGFEELALNRLGMAAPEEFEALLYLADIEAPSELLDLARAVGNDAVHKAASKEFEWSGDK